jgi:membrane associated rhomboid family serine protease
LLPIRDLNPGQRTAAVNWLLIGVTVLIFFFIQGGSGNFERHLYQQAAIPCEVTTGQPLSVAEINGGPCRNDGNSLFPGKNVWFAVVASIFFHGSVGHLLANMWVLMIFGNNIEDAFGHIGFLVFYLLGGLVAAAVHIGLNPTSVVPVVGASGAIAAVMGAYFVLYPGARVLSIIPPFFFWPFVLPAAFFLGIWFLSQFLLAGGDTNIAWEAHVGGFAFGLVMALLFRRRLLAHSTRRPGSYPVGRIYR